MADHEYEEGDTVYLPDGTKGEIVRLSWSSSVKINGMLVDPRASDVAQDWFDPEDVHWLSPHERLRRIEERLGIDD